MYCVKCCCELPIHAKFCLECGAPRFTGRLAQAGSSTNPESRTAPVNDGEGTGLDCVKEASEDSFPASDAPGWATGRAECGAGAAGKLASQP
ncbi:hypothetical protein BH23CHL4_BH23CHL4_13630 [soil metagenome]